MHVAPVACVEYIPAEFEERRLFLPGCKSKVHQVCEVQAKAGKPCAFISQDFVKQELWLRLAAKGVRLLVHGSAEPRKFCQSTVVRSAES